MGASEWGVNFMPYGPRWRTHRKLFHDFINVSATKNYDVNLAKAASNFLINLHRNPKAFREHIHLYVPHSLATPIRLVYGAISRLTGSLALSVAYGIEADTPDNEFFHMYEEMLNEVNEAAVPGAFLVDILPFREFNPLSVDCERTLTGDGCRSQAYTFVVPRCAVPCMCK